MLNLRYIGMALAQTVGTKSPDLTRVDVATTLLPTVQWVIDVMISVVKTLVSVVQQHKLPTETYKQAFDKHIAATGSPSLHLLLCSIARGFLRTHAIYIPPFLRNRARARSRTPNPSSSANNWKQASRAPRATYP